MNVSLPIRDGYMSDYVRHLIRHDQERQKAIASLQQAIDEGINSGEPEPFSFKAFNTDMHKRYVAE